MLDLRDALRLASNLAQHVMLYGEAETAQNFARLEEIRRELQRMAEDVEKMYFGS